ncbi:hypothetical protein [Fibrella forsythiae]|uniref:Uncharacterized protein n=1 Tax=Fibrella forsythiae TaxID=2817061 RepID=A0ABS3JL16_9BACT|nr:hypothetical protein [Fibrella forsythiae]MBO0950688.1 hypothetical protein [Fibrella forsythiae]
MPYKFKKGGILIETGATEIPLQHTKENLKTLLTEIVNQTLSYSHQDFANWCSKFYFDVHISDKDIEELNIDQATINVLGDIDAQWDLYLIHTYAYDELQSLDFSTVKMPSDWFVDWLNQL